MSLCVQSKVGYLKLIKMDLYNLLQYLKFAKLVNTKYLDLGLYTYTGHIYIDETLKSSATVI